jgi:hypothetical protein
VEARLGRHSPTFTLAVYVHLLPDDLPQPSFLEALTGDSEVPARRAEMGGDGKTVQT